MSLRRALHVLEVAAYHAVPLAALTLVYYAAMNQSLGGQLYFVLTIAGLNLRRIGRARATYLLGLAAGAVDAGHLVYLVATRYARPGYDLWSDLSYNYASRMFLIDYALLSALLVVFVYVESRRFSLPRAGLSMVAAAAMPVIAGPLFLLRLHDARAAGKKPGAAPDLRWIYGVAIAVALYFFVIIVRPADANMLYEPFYFDGHARGANTFLGQTLVVLSAQFVVFAVPGVRRWWHGVLVVFCGIFYVELLFAVAFLLHDTRLRRGEPEPAPPSWRDLNLRFPFALTVFVLICIASRQLSAAKPPELCHEARQGRRASLDACIADLAGPPVAGATREQIRAASAAAERARDAARSGDDAAAGRLTRALYTMPGLAPACLEAGDHNYAAIYLCPRAEGAPDAPRF